MSPSYFTLLKIPLLAGRIFSGGSKSNESVIDERMARNIVGASVPLSRALGATVHVGVDARVVGIVATAHALSGAAHTSPQIYRPYLTDARATASLLALFSAFGLIAVMIAALGAFAVLAYAAVLRGRDYAVADGTGVVLGVLAALAAAALAAAAAMLPTVNRVLKDPVKLLQR